MTQTKPQQTDFLIHSYK